MKINPTLLAGKYDRQDLMVCAMERSLWAVIQEQKPLKVISASAPDIHDTIYIYECALMLQIVLHHKICTPAVHTGCSHHDDGCKAYSHMWSSIQCQHARVQGLQLAMALGSPLRPCCALAWCAKLVPTQTGLMWPLSTAVSFCQVCSGHAKHPDCPFQYLI